MQNGAFYMEERENFPQKILLIGYSGSGKTFLSTHLGQCLDCKTIHTDELLFTEDFDHLKREQAWAQVDQIVEKEKAWILDGYKDIFTKREWMESADLIVFLDLGRLACLWQVVKRTWKRWKREHMPAASAETKPAGGQREQTNLKEGPPPTTIWQMKKILKSLKWVLIGERRLAGGRYYHQVGEAYPEKFLVLHNQKEVQKFLADLHKSLSGKGGSCYDAE